MTSTLKILTIVAMIATALMLIAGVVNLFRTAPNSQTSNKLMRWRVILQAVTLGLFSLLLLIGKN